MRLPDAITVGNYRCFADDQTLALRPITLLYGDNNSGKSALMHALPLVLASLRSPAPDATLNTRNPFGRRAHMSQLVWAGDTAEGEFDASLRLDLRWDSGDLASLAYTIRCQDDAFSDHVERLTCAWRDGADTLDLRWMPLPGHGGHDDDLYIDAQNNQFDLDWHGLIPRATPNITADPLGEPIARLERTLRAFAHNTAHRYAYLPATRRALPRIIDLRDLKPDPDWHDEAALVLALLSDADLFGHVSAWFEQHTGGKLSSVEYTPGAQRLMFQRADVGLVDWVDVGEGLRELLPIVTALAPTHAPTRGLELLCLEEPGAHLHPTLQLALAQTIWALPRTPNAPRTVVETHSRYTLLSLQNALADGTLSPEQVALYWVEQDPRSGKSQARRAELDHGGRLVSGWPDDALAQDLTLSRALLRKRMAHTP